MRVIPRLRPQLVVKGTGLGQRAGRIAIAQFQQSSRRILRVSRRLLVARLASAKRPRGDGSSPRHECEKTRNASAIHHDVAHHDEKIADKTARGDHPPVSTRLIAGRSEDSEPTKYYVIR